MYNVFYDQEFIDYYKTYEEAIEHIRKDYLEYMEDINKNADYDDNYDFSLYEILKNVAPDNLEDIVKNKT